MTDDQREFIVVYEEDDLGDTEEDTLVLNVDVEQPEQTRYRVDADFGAVVTNEASAWALVGLIVTLLGGLLAIITAIFFMINYPAEWWGDSTDSFGEELDSSIPKTVGALALVSGLLLVGGNLLVGFGRNLRARGVLHSVHFRPIDERR